jgi:hypothetical protein
MKKLTWVALGVSLLSLGVVSACGSDSKADASFSCSDATADGTSACGDPARMKVFTMPEGFRNVAFGCNGSTGIYVTSRGWSKNGYGDVPSLPSAIAAVPNDPACTR